MGKTIEEGRQDALLTENRRLLHVEMLKALVRTHDDGTPNFADKDSKASSEIARSLLDRMLSAAEAVRFCENGALSHQAKGVTFEGLVRDFIDRSFPRLAELRPGRWRIDPGTAISRFDQYSHLGKLSDMARSSPDLAAILGGNYIVKPDIVVSREPENDEEINAKAAIVDDGSAILSPLRGRNNSLPILHASISCKFTLRSDRAQNARTEALNLIRLRKGNLPHVVLVTLEPLPSRIASISLGTGDVDCVYHAALYELESAVDDRGEEEAKNLLGMMIEGRRLRDISDLPLDLAV